MWKRIAEFILRFRTPLLIFILAATAFFGWQASQVKMTYEFAKAIPTDNPKYLAYEAFKKKFGEGAGLMVIGVQTKHFFDSAFFNDYAALQRDLKKVKGIESILSVSNAINLTRAEDGERLQAVPVFKDSVLTAAVLDSNKNLFLSLPFYKGLLYNPETGAWLMALTVNNTIFNSPQRTAVVNKITALTTAFAKKHQIDVKISGLPYIRTIMTDRIKSEMRFFLIGSFLLSALILLLFFRSVSATILSLAVVVIGVVWSVGTLQLLGYKITLLTALIPPLIVVIGVPNCIYFLNKYHTAFKDYGNKDAAIVNMISKMGIVTLFCNIAAAIGFAVFSLTRSTVLKEFGIVAGINIMMLFLISLILIPIALKLMAPPKPRHVRYLENARLHRWLDRLERWSLNHRRLTFIVTGIVLVISIIGITKLESKGFIVDDLPKTDKIYTDLKFFESNFDGVMPLEIAIDTRKKYGVTRNLQNLLKVDSLAGYLSSLSYIGKPLTITEGLKFAKQAFFEGDSSFYIMPGENDMIALKPYLSGNTDTSGKSSGFSRLLTSFMDSNKQEVRISVNMKDVGTEELPHILDTIENKANQFFDSSKYTVQLTGTSVTFLEGSRFIINGLKESIFWAFLLIALCMLYLFRSFRILLCSLIPNLIPLVMTAGIMGWVGVPLKPSTVLIFSVALGIAIDITIRFLVNYKQQLKQNNFEVQPTVIESIHSTGLSIIYTSIVLTAGFVIFCFSDFGGTEALGWLTSITLVTATIANLVLLPALLLVFYKKK
jgi:predicted RND superfamily exporter protein